MLMSFCGFHDFYAGHVIKMEDNVMEIFEPLRKVIDFPIYREPLISEDSHKRSKYDTILRDVKDGKIILGTISKKKAVFPHAQVLDTALNGLVATGRDFEPSWELSKNAGRMCILFKFYKAEHEVVVGDVVQTTMTVVNDYTQHFKTAIFFGLWRLLCENGMIGQRKDFVLPLIMEHNLLGGEVLQKRIEDGVKNLDDLVALYKNWSQFTLPELTAQPLVEYIVNRLGISQKGRTQILGKLEPDPTKWDVFNAFTEVLSHSGRPLSRSLDSRNVLHKYINEPRLVLDHDEIDIVH